MSKTKAPSFRVRMRKAIKLTDGNVDLRANGLFPEVSAELYRLTGATQEAIQAALSIAVEDLLEWFGHEDNGLMAMATEKPGTYGFHCDVYLPNGANKELNTTDTVLHAEGHDYDGDTKRVLAWAAWHEAEAKRLRDSIPSA